MSRLSPVLALLLAVTVALGACQRTAPTATASVTPAAPPPVALPTGSGCGPEIARTQGIVASDVSTGNLNGPVGERFNADLSRAAAACSAGRDGEALGLLAAAKGRYGYR